MFESKAFWVTQYLVLVVFWLATLALLAAGQGSHIIVTIAEIVLAAHVLELPIAFRILKGRIVAPARVVLLTLLFGVTWWWPASRGVFDS
jgi:hypothetical protein